MAYKVQIADSAKLELAEIVGYIAETLCNKTAASSVLELFMSRKVSYMKIHTHFQNARLKV